ncbi:MAG: DUF4920 domain-containing protein [Bacteriovoracaceae bacterium]|nr:DUF4920 domain-containing protein [Bacteriovoracaceae bacterium]
MKSLFILLSLLVSTSLYAAKEYGGKITLKSIVPLENAVKEHTGKDSVVVSAKVGTVCKKKGCWMILKSKTGDIRVTFKDYKFFVPVSLVGKDILVQGKMIEKKMTLAETKHFVEDEGGDASKVTKPRSEYRIVATAVKVQ